jgi:hypothetical protein
MIVEFTGSKNVKKAGETEMNIMFKYGNDYLRTMDV